MAAWNRIVYCLLKFITKKEAYCASPLGWTTLIKSLVRVTILRGMLNASYEVMVSERCRAHPAVEHLWSLQPTFNDDVDASVNFQFQFAITFRPCYFTSRENSVIMFHLIDCKIINRETCHLFFAEKLNHLFPHMTS